MMDPTMLIRRFALALCVWREGRGENLTGKLMIAQSVENRVQDRRWPATYIDVITQPWQFSAFNRSDPNVTEFPNEDDAVWADCVAAADFILSAPSKLTDANHYHVSSMNPAPSWADAEKVVARVGHHTFYTL